MSGGLLFLAGAAAGAMAIVVVFMLLFNRWPR